jgi:hypothetical protein
VKLRVTVEVLDEETGKGSRRRRELEVPPAVLNVHEVLCEDQQELRKFVADDVLSAALGAVAAPQSSARALDEQLRATEPGSGLGSSGGRRASKLESMLGLDVIDHMDSLERPSQQQQPVSPSSKTLPGWGAIGFDNDKPTS